MRTLRLWWVYLLMLLLDRALKNANSTHAHQAIISLCNWLLDEIAVERQRLAKLRGHASS